MKTKRGIRIIDKNNNIYGDNIGFVELWDFSDSIYEKEYFLEAISKVAGISYGNDDIKNRERLVEFLISNGHTSPFEFIRVDYCDFNNSSFRHTKYPLDTFIQHNTNAIYDTFATFKLKVPIFVSRQIMRHRYASYMELSRRYTKDNKVKFEFYKETEICRKCVEEYHKLIESGEKPEVARRVIPVGAYTTFWMQSNYEGFANFFIYRIDEHAQYETRIVAEEMLKMLVKHNRAFVRNMMKFLETDFYDKYNYVFTNGLKRYVDNFITKCEELIKSINKGDEDE